MLKCLLLCNNGMYLLHDWCLIFSGSDCVGVRAHKYGWIMVEWSLTGEPKRLSVSKGLCSPCVAAVCWGALENQAFLILYGALSLSSRVQCEQMGSKGSLRSVSTSQVPALSGEMHLLVREQGCSCWTGYNLTWEVCGAAGCGSCCYSLYELK